MAANVTPINPTWKNKLARKRNGEPYGDERNVRIALENAPELKNLFQYDEFRDRIELRRPLPGMPRDATNALFNDDDPIAWADEHITELTIWLLQQGFVFLRRSVVQDTVISVAKRNAYHPVREWLNALTWDHTPRLDGWLKAYLNAKEPLSYLAVVGAKFMIGAVARIMEPGCQMDSVLVLEGRQGKGKSSACQLLGREWTRDITGDLTVKDAAVVIQDVWLGEMAELTALKRGEQEAVKGFVSRRIDHYRPPYGRNSVDRPRHTVFIATTNETEYLQDPTGERRFWPVETTTIDLAALQRDVEQLWAEAVERYRAGERWHLNEAEIRLVVIEQGPRRKLSEIDIAVLNYANVQLQSGRQKIVLRDLVDRLWTVDRMKDPQKAGALAQQAARALLREGWKADKLAWANAERVRTFTYIGLTDCQPPGKSTHTENDSESENDGSTTASAAHSGFNGDDSTAALAAESEVYDDDVPF